MTKKMMSVWGSKRKKKEEEHVIELEDFLDDEEDSFIDVQDNHIYYYAPIELAKVKRLIQEVRLLDKDNLKLQIDLGLAELPPIHLHICSNGGELQAGFAGQGVLSTLKSPLHTYIEGGAASAATLFSLSGKKRYIAKNSFILIHQLSGGFFGKFEEMKTDMINKELFMEKIRNFYLEKTKLSEEHLENLLKTDLWLSAEKALEFGLVDEVLE